MPRVELEIDVFASSLTFLEGEYFVIGTTQGILIVYSFLDMTRKEVIKLSSNFDSMTAPFQATIVTLEKSRRLSESQYSSESDCKSTGSLQRLETITNIKCISDHAFVVSQADGSLYCITSSAILGYGTSVKHSIPIITDKIMDCSGQLTGLERPTGHYYDISLLSPVIASCCCQADRSLFGIIRNNSSILEIYQLVSSDKHHSSIVNIANLFLEFEQIENFVKARDCQLYVDGDLLVISLVGFTTQDKSLSLFSGAIRIPSLTSTGLTKISGIIAPLMTFSFQYSKSIQSASVYCYFEDILVVNTGRELLILNYVEALHGDGWDKNAIVLEASKYFLNQNQSWGKTSLSVSRQKIESDASHITQRCLHVYVYEEAILLKILF